MRRIAMASMTLGWRADAARRSVPRSTAHLCRFLPGIRSSRPRLSLALLAGAVLWAASPAHAGEFDRTLLDLGISLPDWIVRSDTVRRPLDELQRERCDETAITSLGEALQKLGRRREAAVAQISFSENCGGNATTVRRAVNILLQLNDHPAVVSAASELIKLEPYSDNGYYLRALGNDRGGDCKKAIDDYATAIELFGNKDRISSVAYLGMMRCYEKLGQFCDAAIPIESWVAINPARNDNTQTRTILANLNAKGDCASSGSSSEEILPVGRAGQTISLSASRCRGVSCSIPARRSWRSSGASPNGRKSRSMKAVLSGSRPQTGSLRRDAGTPRRSRSKSLLPRMSPSWSRRTIARPTAIR